MGSLKVAALAIALVSAVPARAQENGSDLGQWQGLIAEASERFGVPQDWIERVIKVESGGRTLLHGKPITSPAGAMGLMQLMPRTWATMRAMLGLGNDPYAPRDNILAGTAYLRMMFDRFGYPGLYGAYNAGPGRFADYVGRGRGLPGETVAYLAKTSGSVATAASSQSETGIPAAQRLPSIFFALRADAARLAEPSAGMFVPLGRLESENP